MIDALADLEVLENTLVYYIIGDNGASAEGTINGHFIELLMPNGSMAAHGDYSVQEVEMVSQIDKFGQSAAYNHYAVGW